MRVILSRKGFDSSYGGYPSPILPDRTLLSLPIPSSGDKIRYSDLQYNNELTYFDIMKQLKPKIKIPGKGTYKITRNSECHLDPDLIPNSIERNDEWRPLFGQINQAQSHLVNQGIEKGDLFLFFGWFRETEWVEGNLQFKKNAPDLHVIHGYLQIDKIIQPKKVENVPRWMTYHPHLVNEERFRKITNTLYVARDQLTFNKKLPGGGVFDFNRRRVLTKEGRTRSIWRLPDFMREFEITYHSEKSWRKDGSFHSAKIGQEFVIEKTEHVTNWVRKLMK